MVELNYYKKIAKNLINNKTSKEKSEEQIRFEKEINESVNNKIKKTDKQELLKDLLQNYYTKIDDNKFYEEMNKMTKDEQKELIGLLEKYNYYTHNSKLGKEELKNAFEGKTCKQKINVLQNKVAKFEPVETDLTNKNTLKM